MKVVVLIVVDYCYCGSCYRCFVIVVIALGCCCCCGGGNCCCCCLCMPVLDAPYQSL